MDLIIFSSSLGRKDFQISLFFLHGRKRKIWFHFNKKLKITQITRDCTFDIRTDPWGFGEASCMFSFLCPCFLGFTWKKNILDRNCCHLAQVGYMIFRFFDGFYLLFWVVDLEQVRQYIFWQWLIYAVPGMIDLCTFTRVRHTSFYTAHFHHCQGLVSWHSNKKLNHVFYFSALLVSALVSFLYRIGEKYLANPLRDTLPLFKLLGATFRLRVLMTYKVIAWFL